MAAFAGSGSFGDVYQAEYNSSIVAVKRLRIEQRNAKGVAMMKQECKIMLQLRHPGMMQCKLSSTKCALLLSANVTSGIVNAAVSSYAQPARSRKIVSSPVGWPVTCCSTTRPRPAVSARFAVTNSGEATAVYREARNLGLLELKGKAFNDPCLFTDNYLRILPFPFSLAENNLLEPFTLTLKGFICLIQTVMLPYPSTVF